ncbi:MAG: hypothetical protein RLZZ444_2234 [Pseudomonadota bacterium]|jgi:hypothetical protein
MRALGLPVIALSAFVATMLAACSREAAPPPQPATVAQALSPYAMEQARQRAEQEARASVERARIAALPQPDPSTPDSAYVPIADASQLMFLYAANSGLPPDYEQLATQYSSDYRETQDSFRKRDLLAALTPKIDARIADAKTHPYLVWTDSSPDLGHYDFNRKGFPLNTALLSDGGYGYVSSFGYGVNYQLGFDNSGSYRFIPVADEAIAKDIEKFVGSYGKLSLKIQAFARSTQDNNHAVIAHIMKTQLMGPNQQVLAEISAP